MKDSPTDSLLLFLKLTRFYTCIYRIYIIFVRAATGKCTFGMYVFRNKRDFKLSIITIAICFIFRSKVFFPFSSPYFPPRNTAREQNGANICK